MKEVRLQPRAFRSTPVPIVRIGKEPNMLSNILFWISFRVDALREDHEKGAAAVEYGLLVGLIAVAIIFAVGALGDKLNSFFTDICEALPGVGPCTE
jgi:pilus assembly protein Flp/PilA